jgi:adenosylcobinamide-phosphate synthase
VPARRWVRPAGLLLGAAADALLADPRRGHPVAGFGRVAGALERRWYADARGPGAAYTAVLVGGAVGLGLLVERAAARHPVAGVLATAAATWTVLGGTSLARHGAALADELAAGDMAAARARLPSLCGRDPDSLDVAGAARAGTESMAENASDAAVAPLLWGAVAGVPGLLGYRAANTLDAMVGHLSPRHRRFGWAAARLDDLVNLLPARVSAALFAALAPAVGGSPRAALAASPSAGAPSTRTAWRNGPAWAADPRPPRTTCAGPPGCPGSSGPRRSCWPPATPGRRRRRPAPGAAPPCPRAPTRAAAAAPAARSRPARTARSPRR